MKKRIVVFIVCISLAGLNAQETGQGDWQGGGLYTLFVNIVPHRFPLPLLGFVNIAEGDHDMPQIGFVNRNRNDFSTLQWAFINATGGNMTGLQTGFINITAGGVNGIQTGFVNAAVQSCAGAQTGFANITKRVRGLQLGFINYADSIEEGIPVGFVSIVRNGGYKAVEAGISETAPFNVSFKIGVERFYTSFVFSYSPFGDGAGERIMWGIGAGSIIRLKNGFFINPEITSHNAAGGSRQYLSVVPYAGYTITPGLSVTLGPSVVWVSGNGEKGGPESSFYRILRHSINDENSLCLGARMALRFRW
jgi:hypothetical protein